MGSGTERRGTVLESVRLARNAARAGNTARRRANITTWKQTRYKRNFSPPGQTIFHHADLRKYFSLSRSVQSAESMHISHTSQINKSQKTKSLISRQCIPILPPHDSCDLERWRRIANSHGGEFRDRIRISSDNLQRSSQRVKRRLIHRVDRHRHHVLFITSSVIVASQKSAATHLALDIGSSHRKRHRPQRRQFPPIHHQSLALHLKL